MAAENHQDNNTKKRNFAAHIFGMTVLIVLFIMGVGYFASEHLPTDRSDDSEQNDSAYFAVSSDNVISMAPYDNGGLVVLTDTAVKYFDSYGNSIGSNECTFSKPVMKSSGKNILLFDRGSYSMRVEKKGAPFTELTFDSVITTGAIGSHGNYAYVLNADGGYQSHLYVYSFRGEKQFEWGCSSDYITDTAISDNGRNVCAAVVGADNAEYFSEILLFDLHADEPLFRVSLPDIAVYSVTFATPKKVAAFTDHGVFLFDHNGNYEILQDYSPVEMKLSSSGNGSSGSTVINKFGNEKNVLLTVFSKNYKVNYSQEYSEIANCLFSSASYTVVAFNDIVRLYNSEGSYIGELQLKDVCIDCVVSGRNVYVLNPDGIKKHSVSSFTHPDEQ